MLDGKLRQYVQWCLDNCKYTKVSPRQHPPSSVEVAVSMTKLFEKREKITIIIFNKTILIQNLQNTFFSIEIFFNSWTFSPFK